MFDWLRKLKEKVQQPAPKRFVPLETAKRAAIRLSQPVPKRVGPGDFVTPLYQERIKPPAVDIKNYLVSTDKNTNRVFGDSAKRFFTQQLPKTGVSLYQEARENPSIIANFVSPQTMPFNKIIPRPSDQRIAQIAEQSNKARAKIDDWKINKPLKDPSEFTSAERGASLMGGGVPSLATAAGLTALTKSTMPATVLFGGLAKGQTYEEARDAGLDPQKASMISTAAGVTEGALEKIGLDIFFKKFGTGSGISNFVANSLIKMGSEALQEGSQELGGNFWAKVGYDKERDLLEGVFDSMLVGGILGGVGGGSSSSMSQQLYQNARQSGLDHKSASTWADKMADKIAEKASQAGESLKRPGLTIEDISKKGDSAKKSVGKVDVEALTKEAESIRATIGSDYLASLPPEIANSKFASLNKRLSEIDSLISGKAKTTPITPKVSQIKTDTGVTKITARSQSGVYSQIKKAATEARNNGNDRLSERLSKLADDVKFDNQYEFFGSKGYKTKFDKIMSESLSQPTKDDTITLYHASPKQPTKGNWRKGTYFADTEQSARYYAESHHRGNIEVRPVEVPKSLVQKNKSNNIYQLKGEFPISKPTKSEPQLAPITQEQLGYKKPGQANEASLKQAQAQPTPQSEQKQTPKLEKKFSSDNIIPQESKARKIITDIRQAVEDSRIRIKNLQRTKGVNVDEKSDVYTRFRLKPGRIQARVDLVNDKISGVAKDIVKTAKSQKIKSSELRNKVNEFLIARHAPERNSALYDGAAGITTEEANAKLAELSKDKNVAQLADRIQEINNEVLDVMLEGELITKELYNDLKKKYKNHVPLQRIFEEGESFNDAVLGAKRNDVRSSGLKTAKGSERAVNDVLGNITNNLEQAIVRSEKNRAALSVLDFARKNEHLDLFEEVKPRAIGKKFDDSGVVFGEMQDDVLVMRENGETKYLQIKDKELAKVFKGMDTESVGGVIRMAGLFTRFYSGLHTRYNIAFAPSNIIRDSQEMMVFMDSKGYSSSKAGAKVVKNTKIVSDYIFRGKQTPKTKLYQQMLLDGGTTGGMALSTRKQTQVNLDKMFKIAESNPRKAVEGFVRAIDNYNQVFEDATRLAIYEQVLEQGGTRQEAAAMAKEGTIDFNTKGTAGPLINSLYMFANASIQGSAKMIRALKNPKTAFKTFATVAAVTSAASFWNDDKDEKWREKISDWDSKSNWVIVLPEGEDGEFRYLKIPVSWGLKPLKVAAQEILDGATGKSSGAGKAIAKGLDALVDAYNPAGGTTFLQNLSPTITDVPVDLVTNTPWYGGRGGIRPEWKKDLPKSEQYYSNISDTGTGKLSLKTAQGLSGVGIEVSPENLKYAIDQYIGGVGRIIKQGANTTSSLIKGEKVESREIPIVSRFYSTVDKERQEGMAKSSRYDDILSGLKKVKGTEERKNYIIDAISGIEDEKERQSVLYKLGDGGYDTSGISSKDPEWSRIKSEFEKSSDNFKDMGDYVIRRKPDGEAYKESKAKYQDSLYYAQLNQYKKSGNIKAWFSTAEKKLAGMEEMLNDPTLDELDRTTIENRIITLMTEMEKYASYGGFKKPKKGRNKTTKFAMTNLSSVNQKPNVKLVTRSKAMPKLKIARS